MDEMINVQEDRNQWQALVNSVINLLATLSLPKV
jgi:hypothetical protein